MIRYPKFFIVVFLSFVSMQLGFYQRTIDWSKLEKHPRLLLKEGEEMKIKEKLEQSPELQIIHRNILNTADEFIFKPTNYYYKQGKRLLHVSRDAFRVLFNLSYAYRMTGDKRYAVRAEQELRAVAAFPNWNPSHFLDVGEMAMGVSIAYDWLYDDLSDKTKKMVEDAIEKFAFLPADPVYTPDMGKDVNNWFYGATHNWNQVCNGGLGMAALALYESYPEKCDKILKRALETLPIALCEYAPDGAYPEGFGYWGYGTGFQAMLNTSLETALGTDFGLSDYPGFLRSGNYIQHMVAPSLQAFGYSDSGANKVLSMSPMFYIAAKIGDTSLLYNELNLIRMNRFTETLLPSYLIYAKDLDFSRVTAPTTKMWYGRGKTPVVLVRTDWVMGAKFLGLKGGCAQTSHAHLDAGSFVYESDGVRWAIDLPQDSYLRIETAGIDLWNQNDGSERWNLLRQNNKYHNTLTVNDKNHLATAEIGIDKVIDTPKKQGGVLDLTPLFRGDLSKAVREISLNNGDFLQIKDDIQASDSVTKVQWTMVTKATPKIVAPRKIELTQNNKKAELIIDSPKDVSWEVWNNNPGNTIETPNPGTCRVGFVKMLSPKQKVSLKVRLVTKD